MSRTRTRKTERNHRSQPIRFSPYAWAKLIFLRDAGDSEVGCFGISSSADLLLIEDVVLVSQLCTPVTVAFDDASVADFFDDQVSEGKRPEEFGRIWIHTHPGSCPLPSNTDEATFARCFGKADWAVMLILACGGATYARLRSNVGPGVQRRLGVEIDYSGEFPRADHALWQSEYDTHVRIEDPFKLPPRTRHDGRWPVAWTNGDARRQRRSGFSAFAPDHGETDE